jgi:hypothetical protein
MRWFDIKLLLVVSVSVVGQQRHPTVTKGQEFMIFAGEMRERIQTILPRFPAEIISSCRRD